MDMALPTFCQAIYGQFVKMLITLEPYGIFRSNFAYVFNSPDTGMRKGDEALTSTALVSGGLFVKMLINLDLHGIF